MDSVRGHGLYSYTPSLAMSIGGIIGFCTVTGYLVFQYLRTRCWLVFALIIGALMETSGYIARLLSVINAASVAMFLLQYLAIILAPSLLAIGCYILFGRLMWWVTPEEDLNWRTLWCNPRWVTPTFLSLHLFTFLIQLAGVPQVIKAFGNNVSPQDIQKDTGLGMRMITLGLGLQLVCFALFILVGLRFLSVSREWRAPDGITNWRRMNGAVNGAAGFIILRTVYRTFEFAVPSTIGLKRYLDTHEWAFWAFDALPILTSLIIFCVFFPSYYLPRNFYTFRLDKKRAWIAKLAETEID